MFQNGSNRPRLVVADAGVNEDVVMRRLDKEALDAQHHPVAGIDECRLKPRTVFVEQFHGKRWEELQHLEPCALLLDHRIDCDIPERNCCRHHRTRPSVDLPAGQFRPASSLLCELILQH